MRDKYVFEPQDPIALSHQSSRDEIAALFGVNKQSRKRRADASSHTYDTELQVATAMPMGNARWNATHSALHKYEKAHLQGGGDWQRLKQTLLALFRDKLRIAENLPVSADLFVTTEWHGEQRVGTVHFGEDRFVLLNPQPMLVSHPVYVRLGDTNNPPRHYVRLTTSNTHVKRFVTRGLSAFDAMNISRGVGLSSVIAGAHARPGEVGGSKHGVAPGTILSEQEQVLSHTRAWAGNKRYISTGVSNRPAISTRGIAFASMYGVVTVDLAMVPTASIFDLHRHDVASAVLGRPATDILNNGHHTNTNDLAEEWYLALRDTIRTRELLVKGSIPSAALRRASQGRVLLGIGSAPGAEHNAMPGIMAALPAPVLPTIVEQDHMTYIDPGSGMKWHFIEFATPAHLTIAHNALRPNLGTRPAVVFDKFAPIRPPGMI
jgi:hypothetical protein